MSEKQPAIQQIRERFDQIKSLTAEEIKQRTVLLLIIFGIWAAIHITEEIAEYFIQPHHPYFMHLIICLILLSCMLIYSFIVFIVQKRHKYSLNHAENLINIHYPLIELIVPAHNEELVILSTLKNLDNIDYPDLTITVINDHSTDNTQSIVEQYIVNTPNTKVKLYNRLSPEQARGKAVGMNEVIRVSQAEYIFICDADAKVQPDCLQKAFVYFLIDPKLAGIQFQKNMKSNHKMNVLTECQDLEMAFDTYMQNGRTAMNGFIELRGSGMLLKRSVLLELGLWDERALTEDLEMSLRISLTGYKIIFLPHIILEEQAVPDFQNLIKQRKRWAEGSIRRFLKHYNSLIINRKLTLKQKIDLFPFWVQFAFPVWVTLDLLIQLIFIILHRANYLPLLTFSLILGLMIIWLNIFLAVRIWRPEYNLKSALKYSIYTVVYAMGHWSPIVLWSIKKTLLGLRPSEWVKTPRISE